MKTVYRKEGSLKDGAVGEGANGRICIRKERDYVSNELDGTEIRQFTIRYRELFLVD